MIRRRRALGLSLLALAAPLPAFAVSELASTSESRVANLSVSTSLQSCGLLETQLVCTLSVSFEAIEGATSYTASVTRADGSVIDAGAVAPGGSSIYVPYVGSGSYSVRVTAYGDPAGAEETGDEVKPEVIATDAAEATAEGDDTRELEAGAAATVEGEAGPRGDLPGGEAPAEEPSEIDAAAECAETAAAAAATAAAATLPPLPEPPPEELNPENPDEDADGVLDEQERVDYEAAVVARAEAAAQAQPPAPAGC